MSEGGQRDIFTETLREVAEIVKTSADELDREEVLSYFKDVELTKEQKNMVFEYLLTVQAGKTEPDGSEPGNGEGAGADKETEIKDSVNNKDKEAQKDSKALELYLEDIAKIHEYDEEERQRLCAELLNGNGEAAVKLSESMLKEVALMAQEYASEKAGLEDLIQEGNLGIFVRLGELCGMGEDCGYDVEEEMAEAADSAMRAYVSEAAGQSDAADAVVGKLNLVNEAKKFLRGQNNREPSARELSEYTGMSLQELDDIEAFYKGGAGSVR